MLLATNIYCVLFWKLYLYEHVESDTRKGDFDNLQTLQISKKFLLWFHQHANGAIPFAMNNTTLKKFECNKECKRKKIKEN